MDQEMIKILQKLRHGVAVRQDIFVECQPISRRTFDRKIEKLVANDFIKARHYINFDHKRYSGNNLPVLILRPAGAAFLCNEFHTLKREWLRTDEPALNHLMHDLYVTRVYRKIVAESEDNRLQIIQLKGESQIKQEYKLNNRSLKGMHLPDVLVEAQKDDYSNLIYLEVDNASKPLSYWVKKIGSWTGGTPVPDIIFIALNPARLEGVFHALKNNNVKARISFEPLELFLDHGLAHRMMEFKENTGLWFYNHVTKEFFLRK